LQELSGNEQRPQNSGDLVPDASILLLIARGLCHRICRKDLFCPDPKCKAEVNSISGLLKHPDKKHELNDVHCKELV
jgi:hypothetical protein